MEVWTGRPVYEQPPVLFAEHTDKFIVDDDDMDSDTATKIELFSKTTIILEQGEWSSAKDSINTNHQKMKHKTVTIIL